MSVPLPEITMPGGVCHFVAAEDVELQDADGDDLPLGWAIEVGAYVKLRSNLRERMSLPAKTFDTLVLTAAEVPPGYAFDRVLSDKEAVLREAGLEERSGRTPSDVDASVRA